jgi:hypothetical protein
MRPTRFILLAGLVLLAPLAAVSQPPAGETPSTRTGDDRGSARRARSAQRRELEKQFEGMLTGAVLKGTWQMTGEEGLKGLAPLGEARAEEYTISGVSRAGGDYWIINARVQYADKDVTLPITVRVLWAGDTPIITLDKMGLPGLGTYSARVMIYRGFYSGTWFGTNYGGVLSGQIVRAAPAAAKPATRPADE